MRFRAHRIGRRDDRHLDAAAVTSHRQGFGQGAHLLDADVLLVRAARRSSGNPGGCRRGTAGNPGNARRAGRIGGAAQQPCRQPGSRSRPARLRARRSAAGRAACRPCVCSAPRRVRTGSSQATFARSSSGAVSGARATSSSRSFSAIAQRPRPARTPSIIARRRRQSSAPGASHRRCARGAVRARRSPGRRCARARRTQRPPIRCGPARRRGPRAAACVTSAGASKTSVRSGARPGCAIRASARIAADVHAAAAALVRLGRVRESIAEHAAPGGQRRPDDFVDVARARREIDQEFGGRADRPVAGLEHECAQFLGERRAAGFARDDRVDAAACAGAPPRARSAWTCRRPPRPRR